MTQLSIVIFSSRDPLHQVVAAVQHAIRAANGFSYQLHLFFNGDEQRAQSLTDEIKNLFDDVPLNIWFFSLADKANCLNRYWHDIQPHAELHFFVDGYVELLPDSFSQLADAHEQLKKSGKTTAHAYSGIPRNGRSSDLIRHQMITNGGIHGNLFMLPSETLTLIRQNNFYLPLGIYRTDPTMAAVMCFDFHPESCKWKSDLVQVVPAAGWYFQNLRWYSYSDLKTHWLRLRRQALGSIENKALRQLFSIEKQSVNILPDTASELCLNYLTRYPLSWLNYLRHPLLILAERDLAQKHRQKDLLSNTKMEHRKLL